MSTLRDELNGLLAYIDTKVKDNKSTIGYRQWAPSGKLPGQPQYPLLAISERNANARPISRESDRYLISVTFAAIEDDNKPTRGQKTAREIVMTVGVLFTQATDLPGTVFLVEQQSANLNMNTDKGEAGATVTLAFHGFSDHA